MTIQSTPQRPTAPSRPAPPTNQRQRPTFTVARGPSRTAWKLGIYGPEGIGKSSLMASCPGIVVADIENSTMDMDVSRVCGIVPPLPAGYDDRALLRNQAEAWANLRAWVQSLSGGIVGIDSMTRAEDWCAAWVIANKKSNEGMGAADSLEDFKYKAGLTFIVDEFRRFLTDIDNAYMRGTSFVMVAHNRISRIKNPDGSDFIRHEPRLVDDQKASNMLQWVQFLDHLVFIDLDKSVTKGKVSGGGSRTAYFDTAPNRISKTRSLPQEQQIFTPGWTWLWEQLGVTVD